MSLKTLFKNNSKLYFNLPDISQKIIDLVCFLYDIAALLHKGLKGRTTLIEPNLSGNLGMRAT